MLCSLPFAVICSGKCRNTCFPAESTRSYARLETQSSECSWRGLTAPILEIRILTASGNLTDGFKVAWGHFEVNDGENKSCEYLKAKKSPRARFKGMSLNSGFPSSVTRLIPPLIPPLTRYGGGVPRASTTLKQFPALKTHRYTVHPKLKTLHLIVGMFCQSLAFIAKFLPPRDKPFLSRCRCSRPGWGVAGRYPIFSVLHLSLFFTIGIISTHDSLVQTLGKAPEPRNIHHINLH